MVESRQKFGLDLTRSEHFNVCDFTSLQLADGVRTKFSHCLVFLNAAVPAGELLLHEQTPALVDVVGVYPGALVKSKVVSEVFAVVHMLQTGETLTLDLRVVYQESNCLGRGNLGEPVVEPLAEESSAWIRKHLRLRSKLNN